MQRTRLKRAAALILLAGLSAAAGPRGEGPKPEPPTRSGFMRQKLEFSKLVLEGLAVENYDMIAKNARTLRKLSTASEWEVPTIPNADQYVVFTGDFQRLCDDLAKTARDKNLDGATLAYVRLTMSCVNCHKYVRFATK